MGSEPFVGPLNATVCEWFHARHHGRCNPGIPRIEKRSSTPRWQPRPSIVAVFPLLGAVVGEQTCDDRRLGLADESVADRIILSVRTGRRHIATLFEASGAESQFQAGSLGATSWIVVPCFTEVVGLSLVSRVPRRLGARTNDADISSGGHLGPDAFTGRRTRWMCSGAGCSAGCLVGRRYPKTSSGSASNGQRDVARIQTEL